jgi:hypothetical protein
LCDMEKYSTTCSWINDIYGWKCGWQMKMDELSHEHWQHFFWRKIEQEKNDGNFFMLGLFWKIRHTKCSSHTSRHTLY